MNKQYGFLIDSDRCVDCRACVVACKTRHKIEFGVAWRRVTTVWKGGYPNVSFRSTSMACNHCEKPACVAVCPAKAISKRSEDGIVVVDRKKCIGCHSCERACPYHAPQFGADKHMQKCDLCVDLVSSGKKPACVSTCSANALIFGPLDEMPSLAGEKTVKRLDGPTQPSVFVPIPEA